MQSCCMYCSANGHGAEFLHAAKSTAGSKELRISSDDVLRFITRDLERIQTLTLKEDTGVKFRRREARQRQLDSVLAASNVVSQLKLYLQLYAPLLN